MMRFVIGYSYKEVIQCVDKIVVQKKSGTDHRSEHLEEANNRTGTCHGCEMKERTKLADRIQKFPFKAQNM